MKYTALISTLLLAATMCFAQNTPTPQTANQKKGILLVHYGTQNDDSRRRTVDALNALVADRFASCPVVEAYAAPTVIRALGRRGIRKLTIAEALDSLASLGCRRLAVQSTMLLDGVMTDVLEEQLATRRARFDTVAVGRPLLYTVDDCRTMLDCIARSLKADTPAADAATHVVLVGHGSDSPANAMYSQVDYVAQNEGRPRWHVGTIEGYPTTSTVAARLAAANAQRVVLVPLLYIAGNHLRDDIDGTWRHHLESLGYKVSVVKKGLGEMAEVQQALVDRVADLLK